MHEHAASSAMPEQIHYEVQDLGVNEVRRLEVFAGGGGACEYENARTNDCTDAKCG